MSELRTQAAELAAKLLDKLAQTLSNDLKEIAVRLESELTAAGIPLREVRYMESPKYALHDYHEFNHSQLRLELVKHCPERLRDSKLVGSGGAAEFATLKWFVGARAESPLSA